MTNTRFEPLDEDLIDPIMMKKKNENLYELRTIDGSTILALGLYIQCKYYKKFLQQRGFSGIGNIVVSEQYGHEEETERIIPSPHLGIKQLSYYDSPYFLSTDIGLCRIPLYESNMIWQDFRDFCIKLEDGSDLLGRLSTMNQEIYNKRKNSEKIQKHLGKVQEYITSIVTKEECFHPYSTQYEFNLFALSHELYNPVLRQDYLYMKSRSMEMDHQMKTSIAMDDYKDTKK